MNVYTKCHGNQPIVIKILVWRKVVDFNKAASLNILPLYGYKELPQEEVPAETPWKELHMHVVYFGLFVLVDRTGLVCLERFLPQMSPDLVWLHFIQKLPQILAGSTGVCTV